MTKQSLLILGAGSFASEVANLAWESHRFEPVGFVDTRLERPTGQKIEGLPVLSSAEVAVMTPRPLAICALGTTHRGEAIAQIEPLGLSFATLVHPTAHVPASVELAPGVIIGAGAIIGHATHLGAHVIVNRGVLIGHHTRIGALCIVSPGANVAARVVIGERTYLGMGSLVLDGRSVGSGSVVGAGAVVVKDLGDRVQALGMPARVAKEGIDGI